jgi:hypothetical protein
LQSLHLSECRLQQGLLDQLPDLSTLTRLQLRRACLDVADPDAASAAGAATQLHRLQLGSGDEEQQRARCTASMCWHLEQGRQLAAQS